MTVHCEVYGATYRERQSFVRFQFGYFTSINLIVQHCFLYRPRIHSNETSQTGLECSGVFLLE